MMNGVSSVSTTNQNYQIKFGNKMSKAEWKIVDAMNDALVKEPRSLAEKTELAKLKSASLLVQKFKNLFTGKVVKPKETTIEHINTVIETANKASRDVYLEQLRKTDPELYKEVLRRDTEHKVEEMSNVELIKEFIKGFFKKQPKDDYEKLIEQAVKDGQIDADQARTLLLNHGIGKFLK